MVPQKSPLEACDDETTKTLLSCPYLQDFLSLCFALDKSQRPSCTDLLKHPFMAEENILKDVSVPVPIQNKPVLKEASILSNKLLDSQMLACNDEILTA